MLWLLAVAVFCCYLVLVQYLRTKRYALIHDKDYESEWSTIYWFVPCLLIDIAFPHYCALFISFSLTDCLSFFYISLSPCSLFLSLSD